MSASPMRGESEYEVSEGGRGCVNMHRGSKSNIIRAVPQPVQVHEKVVQVSKPKIKGGDAAQKQKSGLGYPPVWWRGPGWKSTQATKPSRGLDLVSLMGTGEERVEPASGVSKVSKSTHGGPASDVGTSGGLASVVGKNTHSGPASDVCQSIENE